MATSIAPPSVPIQMVDLVRQYQAIESEVRAAFDDILARAAFINGPHVKQLADDLSRYLEVAHIIPCANGTDALQVAMMALDFAPGDKAIVPTFTYISTVEVMALLKLQPILVDVDPATFNVDPEQVKAALVDHPETKAIVPVHLFGQCADMAPLLQLADSYDTYLLEDTAQAIGAVYTHPDGTQQRAGTIGDIGATSFYPSKNLGAYGDAGALMTHHEEMAQLLRMTANHGQNRRYYFDRVGVNSRLDTLQAAVLVAKLKRLDAYIERRQAAAAFYDAAFAKLPGVQIPARAANSTHVFHQYTLQVPAELRDELHHYLADQGIPSVVFYPLAVHQQPAYQELGFQEGEFPVAERLGKTVLSLPMHTELSDDQLAYITHHVAAFLQKG